jgi:hypothetical protein
MMVRVQTPALQASAVHAFPSLQSSTEAQTAQPMMAAWLQTPLMQESTVQTLPSSHWPETVQA